MPHADFRTASPEYFRAAGIPLLKGREFTATDRPGSGRVVIINQTLADKFFPDEDPLGKRIAWTGDVLQFIASAAIGARSSASSAIRRTAGWTRSPRPVMFMPFAQELAIRSAGW